MGILGEPSGKLQAFAYLTAENAWLYRAIMRSFTEARERFVLHLRPADVARALRERGVEEEPAAAVDASLQRLCAWGNLQAHPDTADVATVQEFYRPRFLYQLTSSGEAAERAVFAYFEALARQGELQAAALDDIRTLLESVARMLQEPSLDDSAVHLVLTNLRTRFEELTSQAQAFMGSLQRSIDLHGVEIETFVAYKQRLLDYLERFVGQLVVAAADIAGLLGCIDEAAARRLAESAARRELLDALDGSDESLLASAQRWEGRIEGLRGWFLGRPGAPSQAEELRARARAAIPALLAAIASLHDRRLARSDRTADLRVLARWFAEAETDADAHRLWRAAFALAPARHLFVDADALAEREAAPVPAATSWFDAPPLRISPRLRATGHHARRGRPNDVIDRSREKALLVARWDEEARALRAARDRLATGRTTRLSELGALDPVSFEMLLDLIGDALAGGARAGGAVETTSTDGSLVISLVPTGDGRTALVRTPAGTFQGPDHFLTLRPARAGSATPTRAERT